jgi:hypothetical protein
MSKNQQIQSLDSVGVIIYLYNNIVLSMLYAEICPKVKRHNARPGRGVRLEGIMHSGIMHFPEGECIMPSNLGTYFGI